MAPLQGGSPRSAAAGGGRPQWQWMAASAVAAALVLLALRSSGAGPGADWAGDSEHHSFLADFFMGSISAAVSKTAAAPIERVKLLIQSQDEMLRSGRLTEPFRGIGECFARTVREEGGGALWRGNVANVIRYFPTQALNFAFKDRIKAMFGFHRETHGYGLFFLGARGAGERPRARSARRD